MNTRLIIILICIASLIIASIACTGGGGGDCWSNEDGSSYCVDENGVVDRTDDNPGIIEQANDTAVQWVKDNSQGDGYDCLSVWQDCDK